MIVMDSGSARKFADVLAEGGLLIANSSLVKEPPACNDCRVLMVPANEIAAEIGNDRTVNMALLGAWAAGTGIMTVEDIVDSLRAALPERHLRHMPDNEEALRRGAQIGRTAGIGEND